MAEDYPLIQMATRAELHEWLERNHAASRGFWLVSWRSVDLGPRIDYEDVVCECLCYGWIDSTVKPVDDHRAAQRLTPRRPGSIWAQSNKLRLERLEAQGLMKPAGIAVVEQAKADGSWSKYDEVDALIVPDDLAVALSEVGATEQFAGLSPSRRKGLLWWIKSAKRDATRATRIAKTAAAAAEGRSALE